jgi:hypothetical protein
MARELAGIATWCNLARESLAGVWNKGTTHNLRGNAVACVPDRLSSRICTGVMDTARETANYMLGKLRSFTQYPS